MSKLPSTAIRHATNSRHVKQPPSFDPSSLLSFNYTPFPSAINSSTLYQTSSILSDPSHSFYIRTQRRLEDFDSSTKLHWRVQCPTDVSKKAFIRNWAARRVRNAFERELRKREDESHGESNGELGLDGKSNITGALCIFLTKNKLALTASKEEVNSSAAWLLERVVKLRKTADKNGRNWRQEQAVATRAEMPNGDSLHAPPRAAPRAAYPSMPDPALPARDDKTTISWKPFPSPSSDPEAIRAQVEYYFSDANLPRDRFLLSFTEGTANKPVSLKTLHAFKRMRKFQPYEAVREAVMGSRVLAVDENDGVRRRVALSAAALGDGDGEKIVQYHIETPR